MQEDRQKPTIALVVKLGTPTSPTLVKRLVKRLADDQLSATWALSSVEQLGLLSPSSEVALSLTAETLSTAGARLEALRNSCANVTAVCGSAAHANRCLAAIDSADLSAVFAEGIMGTGKPRRLPSGGWQFSADLEAPEPARWPSLFQPRSSQKLLAQGGSAIVSIDLAALAAASSRQQRQVDRLLTTIAWAKQGDLQVATLGELAAEYSQRYAVKPQRSILRAA